MFKILFSELILCFFLIFSSWVQADATFSQMYVFGDSLSDTGNLASVVGDFPPPYYNNRVSNGLVAVDTLAARLGLTADASLHLIGPAVGTNYAVARANANETEPLSLPSQNPLDPPIQIYIDLSSQILSFQKNQGHLAPSDSLYVMFIGGNDIRDALYIPDPETPESQVKSAALQVQQAITSLYQNGARWFLLINAPNIGVIPETRLIAENPYAPDPDLYDRAQNLSKLYRKQLHKIVDQIEEYNDINIVEFDLFKFFNKLVKKADKYGFINATDACFSPIVYGQDLFHDDCGWGAYFNQFVFFDEIHPSAAVHARVGEAFYDALLKMDD